MINNFTIRANPEKNLLKIVLDGFFMKSEVELAMHLAKTESKKLRKKFIAQIDLNRFRTSEKNTPLRIQQSLKLMGCGEIKMNGSNYEIAELAGSGAGFYPYENGWFF